MTQFSLPSARGMGRSLSLQQRLEYGFGIPTWLSSGGSYLTFIDPDCDHPEGSRVSLERPQ